MAPMEQPEITTLIEKVDRLIDLCDQLQLQNRQLLAQERNWREERLQLIEKNDLARQKVEAMILRLKSLEHDSGASPSPSACVFWTRNIRSPVPLKNATTWRRLPVIWMPPCGTSATAGR